MNKTDLVKRVAEKVGMSENGAGQVVTTTFDVIETALIRGERVTLMGFGTFEVVNRAARTGRNPRTGEMIRIPAVQMPRFRPGKALKDALG